MLSEAGSVFPLFHENAAEAYLQAGRGVTNNSTGKEKAPFSSHANDHPDQPAEKLW